MNFNVVAAIVVDGLVQIEFGNPIIAWIEAIIAAFAQYRSHAVACGLPQSSPIALRGTPKYDLHGGRTSR
jgi:hypothetical protein